MNGRKNICQALLIILVTAHVTGSNCAAQYYNQQASFLKANSKWAFGYRAGLDFSTGSPVPADSRVYAPEGNIAVADPATGDLLFYSDGNRCWNRINRVMQNGSMLLGNGSGPDGVWGSHNYGSTTQGVCVIPFIDSPGKYYLFSLFGPTETYGGWPMLPLGGSLFYSVVDMDLNTGLGDIRDDQKNILLDRDTLAESMIAIPGDNCDVWLLVHSYIHPEFKAYHITRKGIDTTPVVSVAGAQLQGYDFVTPMPLGEILAAYERGAMTVSPDRQKIAICSYRDYPTFRPGTAGVLLCRFDPATGIVSDALQVGSKVANSVAFSPDNTKLYMAGFDILYTSSPTDLLQYDIQNFDSASIAGSEMVIAPLHYLQDIQRPVALKLYDGIIYINIADTNVLHTIRKPDLSGPACDFQANAVTLSVNTRTLYSLPNEVVSAFPPDTVYTVRDTSFCAKSPADSLVLSVPAGFEYYIWDDSSGRNTRTVYHSGDYRVSYREHCIYYITEFHVTKNPSPVIELGQDTVVCEPHLELPALNEGASYLWQDGSNTLNYIVRTSGVYYVTGILDHCIAADTISVIVKDLTQDIGRDTTICNKDLISLTLAAHVPGNAQALWSTGSNDDFINVDEAGTYWVMVRDDACVGTDTILIEKMMCACFSMIPSAFSPNGDGLNDLFVPVIEPGCPIDNYRLNIYNRWGQLMFTSSMANQGWNGKFSGVDQDIGTYFYELYFEGGTQRKIHHRKGDVTLIR